LQATVPGQGFVSRKALFMGYCACAVLLVGLPPAA
jgi:hypothetical protein